MTIPSTVLNAFRVVPLKTSEREFHGPWNKLLNYFFPPESPFTVIPRETFVVKASKEESGITEEGKEQPEIVFMMFEVQFESLPVFAMLVAAPALLEFPLAREMADTQARKMTKSLVGTCAGCHSYQRELNSV